MRLSHRDFRPPKRSRYVAAELARNQFAPPRKRPTLRILLLVAFGVLVYLKYDTVIQSSWFQRLRDPGALADSLMAKVRTPSPEALPASSPEILSDSSLWVWSCRSARFDSCIAAWSGLELERKGQVRALLGHAAVDHGLAEADSFAAVFRWTSPQPEPAEDGTAETPEPKEPSPGSRTLVLDALRMIGQGGVSVLKRYGLDSQGKAVPSDAGPWCLAPYPATEPPFCPADPAPRPPLPAGAAWSADPGRPASASFLGAPRQPFHPILPGTVAGISPGPGGHLRIRHGAALFSEYAGYAGLHPALAEGSRVNLQDTLGFLPGAVDSAASGDVVISDAVPRVRLGIRIEKDGTPADPIAFLGLDPAGPTAPAEQAAEGKTGAGHAD